MADIDKDTKVAEIKDFSKGVQRKSTRFQAAEGEVLTAENVSFDSVGGFEKKLGYAQQNNDLTSTTSTSTSTSTTTTSTSTSTTTT